VIGIFSDMVNDCMEIFMDDFTPYGTDFEDALSNLEEVLKICRQSHLSLSTKKCHTMMRRGSAGTLHLLCRDSGRSNQNPGNFGYSNSINSERGKNFFRTRQVLQEIH